MKFLRIISIILLSNMNHINSVGMQRAQQPAQPVQPTPPQPQPVLVRQPAEQIIPQQKQPAAQRKPAAIPAKKASPAQFITPEKSYKDMVGYIKNARNVWDNNRLLLRTDFINTVMQKSNALKFNEMQKEALLQTARDMHVPFSGNKNKDIALLQSIDNQIASAIKQK